MLQNEWMEVNLDEYKFDIGRGMALWEWNMTKSWDARILETQDPCLTILIRKMCENCIMLLAMCSGVWEVRGGRLPLQVTSLTAPGLHSWENPLKKGHLWTHLLLSHEPDICSFMRVILWFRRSGCKNIFVKCSASK